jgi:hypothetical protein
VDFDPALPTDCHELAGFDRIWDFANASIADSITAGLAIISIFPGVSLMYWNRWAIPRGIRRESQGRLPDEEQIA